MTMELGFQDVILKVDIEQDSLPPITVGLYRAFLAKDKVGLDACTVYQFLAYTYRWQRTDRVWAKNAYIQKALKIGERRIRIAKSLLVKMDLIATVRQRDQRGRVTKTYTQLRLLLNPGPSTSATRARIDSTSAPLTRVADDTGGPGPQLLEERKKCLKRAPSTSLAPEEKPKNRVKDKASKEPSNSLFPFMASFLELYKTKTGRVAKPTGKEWGQLKDSVDRWGREDWLERIALLGTERVPRSVTEWLDSNGWKFGHVLSQLFKLDAVIVKERQRLRLLKTCKACRKASETTGIDCPKCGEPDAYPAEEAHLAAK